MEARLAEDEQPADVTGLAALAVLLVVAASVFQKRVVDTGWAPGGRRRAFLEAQRTAAADGPDEATADSNRAGAVRA